MDIFVGNLAPQASDEELLALFQAFGQVKSAAVKRDMFTGVSKGFAFVEMPGRNQSLAAIAGLNGKELHGQPLRVNERKGRIASGTARRR